MNRFFISVIFLLRVYFIINRNTPFLAVKKCNGTKQFVTEFDSRLPLQTKRLSVSG